MSDELDEDDITSAILGECTQDCLCHPAAYIGTYSYSTYYTDDINIVPLCSHITCN